jgi:allantoin racemase
MAKVLWINPVGSDPFDQPIKEFLETVKAPNTEIDVVSLKRGPMHLEYHYYEALILADTLHMVKRAELDGYDAAVISRFAA